MELYYEQNVVNNNIDERIKKTKTLTVIKTVCLIGGVFILVSSALYWMIAFFSIPLFIAFFIVSRLNKRNNTEYDYAVDDECIKIAEIYFRERRKLKYAFAIRAIESVGMFDSEGYKKIERKATKKHLALVNYDDEQAIVYILYNTPKGKKLIFIEPDRGFIMALRRALSSSALTVYDKSMSDVEKYLAKREQELSASDEGCKDDEEDEQSDDSETETDEEQAAVSNDKVAEPTEAESK